MDNVVEMDKLSDEVKQKLRDFDEQEAYFLLCQIFSYAQATKDYTRFQSDLAEWKKRFPVELFSEAYKNKIKYMLSKEFLDTVLKGFMAFDELSKKDPAQGLEKLRKILDRAENHKSAKQLDKDLNNLYSEYPLSFLKEKYPHLVGQLLSKANRTRILQKFDSSLAYKELNVIVEHPEEYIDLEEFKSAINEWQKLYPISDFDDKYKFQAEKVLNETLSDRKLEELFPIASELDLSEGQVIPIEIQKSISLISRDALHDFFKIVDRNKGDIDSLFTWTYKYSRYINSFDSNTKSAIVSSLMNKYSHELPPAGDRYKIPNMEAKLNDLLSLGEYNSIDEIKKASVLQLLGILSTGNELTNEDIYRLNIINGNVQKANNITNIMQKAKIEPKLDLFMQKFPEDKLTPYDELYLNPATTFSDKITVEIDEEIKFEPTKVSTTTSGTTDNGGGFSAGIQMSENKIDKLEESPDLEPDNTADSKTETIKPTYNTITDFSEPEEPVTIQELETKTDNEPIKAVILEGDEISTFEENIKVEPTIIISEEQPEIQEVEKLEEAEEIQPTIKKDSTFELDRDDF